jgi:DNA-binding MarR family transcriptional regulator
MPVATSSGPHRGAAAPAPEGRLSEAISRLMRTWLRLTREDARSIGLSLPQMFLLAALSQVGTMPATGWSEMVGGSPSAATALLDGLESEGFLRRVHDTTDRRKVLVSLTPKGRRVTEALRESRRASWREVCRGIPAPRLDAAATTLSIVVERLARESPERPGSSPTGRGGPA